MRERRECGKVLPSMLSCMSLPSSLGSTELSNTDTTSRSSPHIKPNNCSNISRSDVLVSCTQLG